MSTTPARPDYWTDFHPDYPVEDWKHEVAEDATRMGYHAWAEAQQSLAEEEARET